MKGSKVPRYKKTIRFVYAQNTYIELQQQPTNSNPG